jgi:hypothetical protein
MASHSIQATLAPPAAGLPRFQAVLFRHLLFPAYCRRTSWDRSAAVFHAEGQKVMGLAQSLPPSAFQKRVQIRPLWGIENHSRDWSAEMVLEHLIEVGVRVATAIIELSHGERPGTPLAVPVPGGGRGHAVLQDYAAFLDDYAATLSEDVGDRDSKLTCPHPWFGELTAHRWACLGAFHQALRRRHLEEIVATVVGAAPRS